MGDFLSKVFFKKGQEKLEGTCQEPEQFFRIKVKDMDGETLDLGEMRDRAKCFLIVNVASKCGLASANYEELVEIYKKYHSDGLQILTFPCNQFLGDEKGCVKDYRKYIKDHFGAHFPLCERVEVNGPAAHPLFKYLRFNSNLHDKETGKTGLVPWNFGKFLVSRTGEVLTFAHPTSKPRELIPLIKRELSK